MALNLSKKRARPFSKDSDAMAQSPNKRAKPSLNIQSLPSTDQEVLERAAALLNTPLTQLLGTLVDNATYGHTAHVNPPTWLSGPQFAHLGNNTQPGVSSLGQEMRKTATEVSAFGTDSWQEVNNRVSLTSSRATLNTTSSFQHMQANDYHMFGAHQSDWTHSGIVDGPGHTGGDEGNVETDTAAYAADSDQSSETSERDDTSHLDGQPWESVQINSVSAFEPSNSTDADFLWLDNADEHDEISTQSVCTGKSSNGRESTTPQSRGPFTNQALRDETSNTRKLKACVRCRMQKIRCQIDENDPAGECKTCQSVSKQRLYTLPCARYKLTECTIYRTGKAPGLEFTFRWPKMKLKDITEWASSEVRTISIKSDVCPVPYEVNVRRFVPLPQDSRKRGWMDALKDMKNYVDVNVFECVKYFTRHTDPLIDETYTFARHHMEVHKNDEEGLLLANFFRLWFAIRRTHTLEHIAGKDTLDMDPVTDKSFPLVGRVPLPPVMIQQLDMILTLGILQPLRKRFLEDFQKLVLANKPNTWLTVYLITFMSLHSCAAVSHENYKNARKQGLKRRYAMPAFIQERHHAANVFLSHYHYRTQPCDPFKLDWNKRHRTPFADMTPVELRFIMRTKDLVAKSESEFRNVRLSSLYEDETYFVAQMYEENWQPRDSLIDYDDGTINDVPLRQYG